MPDEGRPGAFWAVLGPDVDLHETSYPVETAAERYRASGDPLSEQMVEMLLQPATRAELIEHAEALQFSGDEAEAPRAAHRSLHERADPRLFTGRLIRE